MRLFVPKEVGEKETRAAMTPETARKLVDLGLDVRFEPDLGTKADFSDAAYEESGAKPEDRKTGLAEAELVLRVLPPAADEIRAMKRGAKLLGFLHPFHVHLGTGEPPAETEESRRLQALQDAGVTGMSLELMPRTTLAQKMDAISSQANLAGYMAVIVAARRLNKIFPMMMTPAGTISPAKVFVIGVGVVRIRQRVVDLDDVAERFRRIDQLWLHVRGVVAALEFDAPLVAGAQIALELRREGQRLTLDHIIGRQQDLGDLGIKC